MRTIVQRKKKPIRLSDEEVLMMLRSYQFHPCFWVKIIQSIKDNDHQLPDDAKKMYLECGHRQLKNRLSNKYAKLMCASERDIKNALIRYISFYIQLITGKHYRVVYTPLPIVKQHYKVQLIL